MQVYKYFSRHGRLHVFCEDVLLVFVCEMYFSVPCSLAYLVLICLCVPAVVYYGTDAEIKVPSVENSELTSSPIKAWSRSEYNHACLKYQKVQTNAYIF